jgi:glycosyltransferase involved in cell wall biosynthesis
VHWVGSLPPELKMPALSNWLVHPRLSNEEYRRIMTSSRVVLFTSEYEGFGMPPVEGLLAGACPVYSDIPVAREVMDGAGMPFANESYASFARAMDQALHATPDAVALWGRKLCARHSWDVVCSRVIQALLAVPGR